MKLFADSRKRVKVPTDCRCLFAAYRRERSQTGWPGSRQAAHHTTKSVPSRLATGVPFKVTYFGKPLT